MSYFDIHTHMIPGIDDGSPDEETTFKMLKMSYDKGVGNIILTSHYNEMRNQTADVKEHIEKVQNIASRISDDLNVYAGNEIFYTNNSKRLLQEKKIATLADSKYVLIEFFYDVSLREIENAVNELSMCGYWPIIAHIERYACMHEKGAAQYISSLGAYLQMNAGYIMNAKFKDSRFISKLFKEGLISFVASDSHNITSRAPNLGECADFLNKKYSSELTETLLIHNPQKIINKQRI